MWLQKCGNYGLELAKRWLDRMIANSNNAHHHLDEECRYCIGEYLFEAGEYEQALVTFKDVVKDAGFQYFEHEDSKYLDFYKNPQKYMKP